MQHGVGVAVPAVLAVPAGRGQQAATALAVGVAAGDLPGDVLGVGIDHVEAERADVAHRLVGGVHRLGARQVEEGVEGLVGLEQGGLQGDAVAAGQGDRLQRVLALAEHAVEQRAVARFNDGLAQRVLALDEEGFLALARQLPLAVGEVFETAALAAHLLEEQVLGVAHDHGHAPGQLAVEAGDHRRDAGHRHAGRLVFRRADMHEAPQRGLGQRQVRVVGQQALAAAAALRSDGPVVGGGHAEHVQRRQLAGGAIQRGQTGDLPGQLEPLELVRLILRQRLVRVGRQQPGQLVGADLLRQRQAGDLLLQVDRQAEVEQAEDQRRVFRLPVLRAVAGGGQVHRQLVAVAE
ncbi:hypothetical protein D3C84_512340 [compost metagenome]